MSDFFVRLCERSVGISSTIEDPRPVGIVIKGICRCLT